MIVEGSLDAIKEEGEKHTFVTSVSGLKPNEVSELINFQPGPSRDNYSLDFHQHPCVILNALEVLGFQVVSSNKGNEIQSRRITTIWTLRKDFDK